MHFDHNMSLKQHIKDSNFQCKILIDLPVLHACLHGWFGMCAARLFLSEGDKENNFGSAALGSGFF